MIKQRNNRQNGAVSIFIVVFTALLVTVVTASFIQIMLNTQKLATANDLSQSAYDSALAGVEDARRALIKLEKCNQDPVDTCETALASQLGTNDCKQLGQNGAKIVTFNSKDEVQVGDESLNQAYTCVKVKTNTPTVAGEILSENDLKVIPLRGDKTFNQVVVWWYMRADAPGGSSDPAEFTETKLSTNAAWPSKQPSVLRSQLIQVDPGSINLSNIGSEARSLLLYPSLGAPGALSFDADARSTPDSRNDPKLASCKADFSYQNYSCMQVIDLPATPNRQLYLQLAAYYKATHFMAMLRDSTAPTVPVQFVGVQPEVDSTGRADSLFRRIKSRIDLSSSGSSDPYPNAALYVRDNLCKDFFVTDNPDNYRAYSDPADSDVCEPSTGLAATDPVFIYEN